MKKYIMSFLSIISVSLIIPYASDVVSGSMIFEQMTQFESSDEKSGDLLSGEQSIGANEIHSEDYEMKISGEKNDIAKKQSDDKKSSGETKTLSEEGANVDTSITQTNYKVETPTIVLLILFGILTTISIILFAMKI